MILNLQIVLAFIALEINLLVNTCEYCSEIGDTFLYMGKELENEFRYIDKILVERTSSEDVDENMKIVSKLYEEDLNGLEDYVVFPPSKLLQAEKMFLSLRSLTHEQSCKMRSLNTLKQNRDAILNQSNSNREEERMSDDSRIVKLFLAILKQHALLCKDEWPKKVLRLLSSYDGETLNHISNLTGGFLFNYVNRDGEDQSDVQKLKSAATFHHKYTPEYTYDALDYILLGRPDEKFIRPRENEVCGRTTINEIEFKRVYKDYLVESCRRYIGTFRNVFELVDIEAKFVEPESRYPMFFLAWAWYRLCSDFMEQKEALLGELISHAHERRCYM